MKGQFMEQRQLKILILDDEAPLTGIMTRVLAHRGYQTYGATTSNEAIELFHDSPIDGLDVLEIIRQEDKDLVCVVFSCCIDDMDMRRANALNVFSCIMKPLKTDDLFKAVDDTAEFIRRRQGWQIP
jgi:CheY-like chemotaxis protein